MGVFDDEPAKPSPLHVMGQDLSMLSVAELSERISQLRAEIARLESELNAKDNTRNAAEALFRKQ